MLKEIRNTALNLLSRREHSELELTRKLRKKDYAATDTQTVIAALVAEGLLSNQRFVENYIHFRQQKGYGPLHIQAELMARGIPEDMIEHHLNIADNAWLVCAQKVWRKRFKSPLPTDFNVRVKQMRFLQTRGFTPDQINHIFHSDIEDAYE